MEIEPEIVQIYAQKQNRGRYNLKMEIYTELQLKMDIGGDYDGDRIQEIMQVMNFYLQNVLFAIFHLYNIYMYMYMYIKILCELFHIV